MGCATVDTVMQKYEFVFVCKSPCNSVVDDENEPEADHWYGYAGVLGCEDTRISM